MMELRYELIKALKPLANIPYEQFDRKNWPDDTPLMGWNEHKITIEDVKRARLAVKALEEM